MDVIISRPNGAINPNFLALWVNSPLGKDQVLAGQGGLAQQHFNIGQMKKLLVAVPSLVLLSRFVTVDKPASRAEQELFLSVATSLPKVRAPDLRRRSEDNEPEL